MRINVFAAFYQPHVGGYCQNIHELAKRLVVEGHAVKVITCNTEEWPEDEYNDGIQILRLPCWQLLDKQYPVLKPSLALLRAWWGKPDLVMTQTRFFSTSLLGALFAWVYPCPLIHVERGSVHSVVSGGITGKLVRAYDHTLGALVVRRAKVNIGVSQAACDFVGHLGGKRRKVIYNGVAL